MQLNIPHKLSKAEAKANIDKFVADAQAHAGTQGVTIHDIHWDADTLSFDVSGQGQRITGAATVYDDRYDINVKLPLMMRMFEGRLKKMLEEQTKALGQGN